VQVSVEQPIIIKFLTKEGCKPSEICSRLKRQYGEKTLSNVSAYKWSNAFKKGRETVENEPYEHRPRTSITGENSDRVHALIRENRRITVHELSGILSISDGSVTTIIKSLTLRLLMSYIYIYMEHQFLMFLDHTRRRNTVGRTPPDE